MPGSYEFGWDAGHLIFLGGFGLVCLAIAATLAVVWSQARSDLRAGRHEEIRWVEDFHDLPASRRRCRHEMSGRVRSRICPNAFDCGRCAENERLGAPSPGESYSVEAADRLYHRGHAWIRPGGEGLLEVGLGDEAILRLGEPDRVILPREGTRLRVNGTAWKMGWNGHDVRVLSPIDGVVVATGGAGRGWYLMVRPDHAIFDDRHLLRGREAAAWLRREAEAAGGGADPEEILLSS